MTVGRSEAIRDRSLWFWPMVKGLAYNWGGVFLRQINLCVRRRQENALNAEGVGERVVARRQAVLRFGSDRSSIGTPIEKRALRIRRHALIGALVSPRGSRAPTPGPPARRSHRASARRQRTRSGRDGRAGRRGISIVEAMVLRRLRGAECRL